MCVRLVSRLRLFKADSKKYIKYVQRFAVAVIHMLTCRLEVLPFWSNPVPLQTLLVTIRVSDIRRSLSTN